MPYVYATKELITQYHDARLIVQLTNDDDAVDPTLIENLNEDILTVIENSAAQTVDNFLRYVYDNLPLTGDDLTSEIEEITAHLTWCLLWERRGEEPEQVGLLRERMLKRLEDMADPAAREVRGERSTAAYPTRSTKGKAQTLFDQAGYFDGLRIAGRRPLPGDTENAALD